MISTARLISVNVGEPRELLWMGRTVKTGIFKEAIRGRVAVRRLNLNGDKQADLSVHGGLDKAVYLYPAEHYVYWQEEYPGMQLPWGMFGENLTTEGMLEDEVSIGDQFRVGSVELMVTQPRLPCYKLGIRFGRDDIIQRFMAAGRPGFYLRVLQEGEVGAGDTIERISRDDGEVTVSDVFRLIGKDRDDTETLRRAVQVKTLPDSLRSHFLNNLERQAR
jgi:MOSC domain-containing protein YiiM